MNPDLPVLISRELAAAGLRPDPEHFGYLRARLYHWGELEHEWLHKKVGPGLERNSKDAFRLLGFGHVMTEFAIAHLGIPGKPEAEVLSLGALSNLIVSSYDSLLDSGHDAEGILPRSRLTGGPKGHTTGDPFITRLVNLYFGRVSSLPHPHAVVRRTLHNAILRMYDAERATIGSGEFSHKVWRRKSALPFVIMGLPVWMTVPSLEAQVYRGHLEWLYRLGLFFGWIDDAADLADDRSARRFNYFGARKRPGVARRIAHHAVRLLEQWSAGVPKGRYGNVLQQTFLAVTWSWLGIYKDGELRR